MPSRRCPHCRLASSYHMGGEKKMFDRKLNLLIRLDECRDEDCGQSVAVVFHAGTNEEVEVFPALDEKPDELLPADVATAFRQALRSLNEGIWDGCVLMCRRALEEATWELGARLPESDQQAYKKKVLYLRIKYLANQHMITPDLGEWAHEGRMAGKLGAHGGEQKKWNTERDAAEIMGFANWFFRYVFILPKQLAERRKQAATLPDEPKEQSEQTAADDQETPARAPGEQ